MQELQDDIILAFKEGDEKAFNAIYKYYYREIRYFTESVIGHTEEAKDITIHTFTVLFRLHANFESLTNIKAFLYITARNNCFNFLKSEKRSRQRFEKISNRHEELPSFEYDSTIQHPIIEGVVLKEIYEAAESLPTECKRIFKLLFYEGLKPAEIAEQLSITPETVRSQKRRALELLRIKFANDQLAVAIIVTLSIVDFKPFLQIPVCFL